MIICRRCGSDFWARGKPGVSGSVFSLLNDINARYLTQITERCIMCEPVVFLLYSTVPRILFGAELQGFSRIWPLPFLVRLRGRGVVRGISLGLAMLKIGVVAACMALEAPVPDSRSPVQVPC
jgi:hypothetical protein